VFLVLKVFYFLITISITIVPGMGYLFYRQYLPAILPGILPQYSQEKENKCHSR
jgi:hypothetical protein